MLFSFYFEILQDDIIAKVIVDIYFKTTQLSYI